MIKAHKRGLVPKDPNQPIIDTFESDFQSRAFKLNQEIIDAWTLFQNTNGFNSQSAFERFNQCVMRYNISSAVRAQQPFLLTTSDLE